MWYGDDVYSYGHRGTSGDPSQKAFDSGSGGVSYPTTFPAEIDLMKYYHGDISDADRYNNTRASELGVNSLIWLSRVEFHG